MSINASGRFMYFAFGSNLLKERLQVANPSAIFHTTGRLKDHELSFGLCEAIENSIWHGGVATIAPCPGAEVWGVIWTLSSEDLPRLDKQEGVNVGIYSPLEVSVETDKGLIFCRTYQTNNFHACPPSPQYKQVVCLGAERNGLPGEYLKKLEAIQTNNYSGPSMLDEIRIDE
ncbi:gamma-glutamylcyclotransferase a [Pungitius pungitius]|uniref:gamma-glutamylcyclotransferase a n=1 Tax=Pungitius pungitius TaxID=134920 RepID=UPI002E148DC9